MSIAVKIGVLVLQGAFAEHEYSLQNCLRMKEFSELDLNIVKIRKYEDLQGCHGLIIPGGESTTLSIFLRRNNFAAELAQWIHGNGKGRPFVWGTCAGLILLSNNLKETMEGGQISLGGIDITTTRNIYGRQTESFEAEVELKSQEIINIQTEGKGNKDKYHGVFIRAPGIKSVDSDAVEVLATYESPDCTKVIAVKQGQLMATTFHPELTEDCRWHAYFLQNVLLSLKGQT